MSLFFCLSLHFAYRLVLYSYAYACVVYLFIYLFIYYLQLLLETWYVIHPRYFQRWLYMKFLWGRDYILATVIMQNRKSKTLIKILLSVSERCKCEISKYQAEIFRNIKLKFRNILPLLRLYFFQINLVIIELFPWQQFSWDNYRFRKGFTAVFL